MRKCWNCGERKAANYTARKCRRCEGRICADCEAEWAANLELCNGCRKTINRKVREYQEAKAKRKAVGE